MPSPFPGMDPYLEDPALWPDVHHELISTIRAELNRRIRPRYFARLEQRIYISDETDPGRRVIAPDVRILGPEEREDWGGGVASGGVAVAEPIVATTMVDEEIVETFIEVIDPTERSLVTVIEILSPSNKVPGSKGRADYLRKRQQVLHSSANLVEIDLLRDGETLPLGNVTARSDYCIHVSRVEERPQGRVWLIGLEHRLPMIPIPLRLPDSDVLIDLQEILSSAYGRAGYDAEIDYFADPKSPLRSTQQAWIRQIVQPR